MLTGIVERITFHAEESGYTVARLQCPRARDLVTVVGNFANIQAGQTLQLRGVRKNHPQYGEQFEVQQYTETKPSTLTGIEKYLGSGLIKGVDPVMAKRINNSDYCRSAFRCYDVRDVRYTLNGFRVVCEVGRT
jgi:exodeoxyribonuclease V alpha subunit